MAYLKLTKAYNQYGASLGRATHVPVYGEPTEKLHLTRVYINQGGYDNGGAYWGLGQPLYIAYNDDVTLYIRADNREDAKAQIVKRYSYASLTFYC